LTLTDMTPQDSVMNSGNAVISSWASSLMWIFRAETWTDRLHCSSSIHALVKRTKYIFDSSVSTSTSHQQAFMTVHEHYCFSSYNSCQPCSIELQPVAAINYFWPPIIQQQCLVLKMLQGFKNEGS